MRVPSATYRLQLGPAMGGFEGARGLIPYLDTLGVSDLYTSPLLQARPGSTHGYDVTDPGQLNVELGTAEEFDVLAASLAARGMGLVVDIVPNHMAAGVDNPWWRSVLEHGPASPYASFFDIEWQPLAGLPPDQLLLPILGRHYGDVLESGDLTLAFGDNGFMARYYDHEIPLDPSSCAPLVLEIAQAVLADGPATGPQAAELKSLAEQLAELPRRTTRSPARRVRRVHYAERIQKRLQCLTRESSAVASAVQTVLSSYRPDPQDPQCLERLDRLLSRQAYSLRFWRTAGEEVNYRRFFDIGDLVGLRADDPKVFEATHRLILRLIADGKITGLRVDHVDGLYDPEAYLRELARRAVCTSPPPSPGERRQAGRGTLGRRTYTIVEKILARDEELPESWPVQGTTGYEFMNTVGGLFVDAEGLSRLQRFHARFVRPAPPAFDEIAFESKRRVLRELFVGDVRNLETRLIGLARRDRHGRDLTGRQLAAALDAVSACLEVYRTYYREGAATEQDRSRIAAAVAEARRRHSAIDPAALDFVERVLLLRIPSGAPPHLRHAWLDFVCRWQQLTGPVTAKGIEDTALYLHNVLTSVSEVGGDPGDPAVSVSAFHARMARRQERWPGALNATATHDTKRGEDVRARLHVLSELPVAYGREVRAWARLNAPLKERIAGRHIPGPNHEWLLYQALLGVWPLDPRERSDLVPRLQEYAVKAAREANADTSWLQPDLAAEEALRGFVRRILDPRPDNQFLARLDAFHQRIALFGVHNSLSQLLLKIASPGVPDIYQGTETWSFTLVDPDNRRAVDFHQSVRRLARLTELAEAAETDPVQLTRALLASWRDGRIKLHLTTRLLHFRRTHAPLFQRGSYRPLPVAGRWRDKVCVFARHLGGMWALAVAPRLIVRVAQPDGFALGERWRHTRIRLPPDAPSVWHDVVTGDVVRAVRSGRSPHLMLSDVLRHLPVALLSAGSVNPPWKKP